MSEPKTTQEAVDRRAQAMEDLFNLDAQLHTASAEQRQELLARRDQLTREVTNLKRYLYATKNQPDDVALHKRSLVILKQMQNDGVDINQSEQEHIDMLEKRIERTA